MITKDDIATYRATYPREHLDQKAKEQNLHCGTPLGSVLALNTLCDAYEEIEKQRDELLAALELLYDHCRLYHRDVEKNNVGEQVSAAIARVKGQQ